MLPNKHRPAILLLPLFLLASVIARAEPVSKDDLVAYFGAREQQAAAMSIEYEYTKVLLPGYQQFLDNAARSGHLARDSSAEKYPPKITKDGYNIDQYVAYKKSGNKYYFCVDDLTMTPPSRQEYYYNGLFEWQYVHNNNRVDIVGKPSTLPHQYDAVVFDLLDQFEAPRGEPQSVSQTLANKDSTFDVNSDNGVTTVEIVSHPANPNAPKDIRWVWRIALDPQQYDIKSVTFMGAHLTSTGLECYDPGLETIYSDYKPFGLIRLPTVVKVTQYLHQTDAATGQMMRYALTENTFTLKKADLDTKISDDQFKFNYKKGMTVVDQPAAKVYTIGDNLEDLSKDLEKYTK